MKKPFLYIMSGRSFAGKTTLRNELVKRFNLSVASVDQRIDYYGFKVADMTQDDWNKVYSETYDNLKKLLKEGNAVILDMGNLEKHERDTARAIAQEYNVPYQLIYVDTPLEKVKKRWLDNQTIEGARTMDKNVFDKAQEMFEEPTPDENPVTYNNTMDLDKWIKENIDSGS